MNKSGNKLGFTLIELMVVVIIVGILAAVAVPMLRANKSRAIASEMEAALGTVDQAAKMYTVKYDDNAPANLAALVAEGFIAYRDIANGTYFSTNDVESVADGFGYSTSGGLKKTSDNTVTVDDVSFSRANGIFSNVGEFDGSFD